MLYHECALYEVDCNKLIDQQNKMPPINTTNDFSWHWHLGHATQLTMSHISDIDHKT